MTHRSRATESPSQPSTRPGSCVSCSLTHARELAEMCALDRGCFVACCRGGRGLGRRLRRRQALALGWLRRVRWRQAGLTLQVVTWACQPWTDWTLVWPDPDTHFPTGSRRSCTGSQQVHGCASRAPTSSQRRAHCMCIAAKAATKRTLLPVAVRDTIRCTACLPARDTQAWSQ